MRALGHRSIYHNSFRRSRPHLSSPISSLLSATTCGVVSLLVLLSIAAVVVEAAPSPLSPPSPPSLEFLLSRFNNRLRVRSPAADSPPPPKLILDYDSPTPSPEEGAPLSAGALRDPVYLPAQIGGIVGSYALSLVLVAIALLALAKRRRSRLLAVDELEEDEDGELKLPTFEIPFPSETQTSDGFPYPVQSPQYPIPFPLDIPQSPRNFSYPALASPTRTERSFYTVHSTSTIAGPGVDLAVDQDVVAADRQMAQNQLEDMYRLVMEQEAAKEAGVQLEPPFVPGSRLQQQPPPSNTSSSSLTKKERFKPASLNLSREEKPQSRTSSILSVLKSPRKKKMQGMSISSPIMTPMSATFPRGPEGEEMSTIPPRHYAPAAPPPIPMDHPPRGLQQRRQAKVVMPLTPDMSPNSTQSIDEMIGGRLNAAAQAAAQAEQDSPRQGEGQGQSQQQQQPQGNHSRNISTATSEADPVSAVSERSTSPLVGLPSSPKPSVTRFPSGTLPSLPSSPKPGATFQRPNAPSAVRTGGALPLRAYEPSLASPTTITRTTKETTFERMMPLSPGGQRTPFTGMAVPYSPYQPFSPVVPMTPSLVTRADRKRMKKFEPKTPTLEMVKSSDDIW